jgi:hypothetical protein
MANAVCRLSTNKADFRSVADFAEVQLGGIYVYSDSGESLHRGLGALETVIAEQSHKYFLCSRSGLDKQVSDFLGNSPGRAMLSAVFGRLRRVGTIDALTGVTFENKSFYSYFHIKRRNEVVKAIADTTETLKQQETLSVRQVQMRFFPSKPWGSFGAASALLGHLAWRGFAAQVDKDIYAWPREVADAFR